MYRAVVAVALKSLICCTCVIAGGVLLAAPFDDLGFPSTDRSTDLDLLLPAEPEDPPQTSDPQPEESRPQPTPSNDDTVSPTSPVRNTTAMNAARAAFEKKDIGTCLSLLTVAKAQDPTLPPPRLILADMYFQVRARGPGREMLERVAMENPSHPELWRLFGSVALTEQRWTEAIMSFEHGLSLPMPSAWSPAQQQTFIYSMKKGLVAACERRGDSQRAAALLGEMTEMAPKDSKLRDRYASTLFRLGMKDKAYEQFRIAYLRDDDMSPPELSMGIMSVNEGDFELGNRWFERAVKADPSNAMARFQIAVALMVQDRADESAKHSAKAAQLGMDSADLQMVRGYAMRQLRRYKEAEEFFRAALKSKPNDAAAMNQLALVLIEQKDPQKKEEALELARAMMEERANSANAQATLGWVMYRSGMVSEAEDAFREAMQKPGIGPEGLYLAGRAFSDQGNESDASKAAQLLATRISSPGIYVLRPLARQWLASQVEASDTVAIP